MNHMSRESLLTLQLPSRDGSNGPVTRARLRRTLLTYAVLFGLGCALAWSNSPQLASLGLGLMLPGGGFVLHAGTASVSTLLHLGLFAGTLLLFVLALFLWAATGNLLAPVLLWLGTALAAAGMDHWREVGSYAGMGALCRGVAEAPWRLLLDARTLLPAMIVLAGLIGAQRLRTRAVWLGAEHTRINAYLRQAPAAVLSPVDVHSGLPATRPLSEADLPLWRFMLDRALQPVENFDGFDRIDEFREAAKRYQICNLSYMLSIDQYVRTPAFRGYLDEAQHRLAQKMMDHRVWSYWRLENIWGNLSADPNPLGRDNIMYYGWYGGMLGMQLCNTGDERWCAPGSIRLKHPSGMEYTTSFSDICALVMRNMATSDYCLFPCEPRWIYPICNNFGALSLKTHDRHFGTQLWDSVAERYRHSLEHEFITPNGRITAIRDYYTGLTIPALTATMADAVTALFLHPLLPDIALRSWTIIRHELIRVANGELQLHTNGWDKIDFGNYRRTLISTYALIAASAREMGDDEVADLLLQRIESEYPHRDIDGVRHYPGASVSAHAVIHAARVLRSNGFHDLVAHGMPQAWREGPLLSEATYPDVLVAGAVSDGAALHLHLAPGRSGKPGSAARQTLGLSQLRPGQRYRIEGGLEAELRADEQGCARLGVALHGLQAVHVLPVH